MPLRACSHCGYVLKCPICSEGVWDITHKHITAYVLTHMYGLSYRETAERMGYQSKTSIKRLIRDIRKNRPELLPADSDSTGFNMERMDDFNYIDESKIKHIF